MTNVKERKGNILLDVVEKRPFGLEAKLNWDLKFLFRIKGFEYVVVVLFEQEMKIYENILMFHVSQ